MAIELLRIDQRAIWLGFCSWWRPACLGNGFGVEAFLCGADKGILGWVVIEERRLDTHG